MRQIIRKILQIRKPVEKALAKGQVNNEEQVFLRNAQAQLKELAKKGLSIPVFTL